MEIQDKQVQFLILWMGNFPKYVIGVNKSLITTVNYTKRMWQENATFIYKESFKSCGSQISQDKNGGKFVWDLGTWIFIMLLENELMSQVVVGSTTPQPSSHTLTITGGQSTLTVGQVSYLIEESFAPFFTKGQTNLPQEVKISIGGMDDSICHNCWYVWLHHCQLQGKRNCVKGRNARLYGTQD